MDPVGRFIGQCCELDPGAAIPAADFYEEYEQWVAKEGLSDPLTRNRVGRIMSEKGFRRDGRSVGGRTRYLGITLTRLQPPKE